MISALPALHALPARATERLRATSTGVLVLGMLIALRVAFGLAQGTAGSAGSAPDLGDAVFLASLSAAVTTLGLVFHGTLHRALERALHARVLAFRGWQTRLGRVALGLLALTPVLAPVLAVALSDVLLAALFVRLTQS